MVWGNHVALSYSPDPPSTSYTNPALSRKVAGLVFRCRRELKTAISYRGMGSSSPSVSSRHLRKKDSDGCDPRRWVASLPADLWGGGETRQYVLSYSILCSVVKGKRYLSVLYTSETRRKNIKQLRSPEKHQTSMWVFLSSAKSVYHGIGNLMGLTLLRNDSKKFSISIGVLTPWVCIKDMSSRSAFPSVIVFISRLICRFVDELKVTILIVVLCLLLMSVSRWKNSLKYG